MNFLLLPLAVMAFALNAVMTRRFQLKFPGRIGLLRLYQAFFCTVASIAFGLCHLIGTGGLPSASTLLAGGLFGSFFYLAVVGSSLGYELGSMSLTSIITNLSLLIPLLYSCITLREPLQPLPIVGICLILCTLILSAGKGNGNGSGSGGLRWLSVVLLAFFANGSTAVIQKYHALSEAAEEKMMLLTVAYGVAAILFFVTAILTAKKRRETFSHEIPRAGGAAILSGLGSFGGNALLGYLCIKIPGAVLYPCLNGGLCILCAILSFVLFREKPTRKKLFAIGIGAVAIVLLSL